MIEFNYGFFEIDITKGVKFISQFSTTKETYEKLTTLYANQKLPKNDIRYIVAKFDGDIRSPRLHGNENGGLTDIPKETFEMYKNMKLDDSDIKDEMSEKLKKLLKELTEG